MRRKQISEQLENNFMSNLLKSKIFLGFMVLAFVLVGASVASAAYSHTMTLKMGMSNSQVMSLQQTLNGGGFLVSTTGAGSPGMESMYFGAKTKAAVMAFQSAKGLSVDGVVGPQSGAALAAMTSGSVSYPAGCTSNSGYSTTTGQSCAVSTTLPAGCTSTMGYSPTTGASCSTGTSTPSTGTVSGEGSVKDFSLGSPEETTVSEGQEAVELIAFDVELEDDGALKLDRFDVYLGQDNTVTASNKPWDYFKSASLWAGSTKLATMDVDASEDWSEFDAGTLGTTSQEYRLRFSGLNAVLASDDTTPISVSFDIASNIDTADEDAVWQYGTETDSFRFVDGTGFTFTDGEDLADSFSFDTAEEAGLQISSGNNDPEATVIEVDSSADTNGVTIGEFEVEETEDINVNITEMTVTLATSDTITDVVKKLYIYNGSTLVGQETVTGTTVTFDNIDLDVNGDDTVVLTVKADFDDTNAAVRYQNGDTISISAVNLTEYVDAMDNDEGDFTESGSYVSETHALYSEGIRVVFDESSYLKTSSDTSGINETVQFTLEFDITAFGEDMYIDNTCGVSSAPASTYVTALAVSLDGDTNGSSTTCTDFDSTGDEGANSFEVLEGQTEHFTVTILGDGGENAASSATFTARLESIAFTSGAEGGGDTTYQFDLSDYKSSAVTVFDR
jgi:peptidoglycan hydrolase-like protein with peptidoglycan-binding domain